MRKTYGLCFALLMTLHQSNAALQIDGKNSTEQPLIFEANLITRGTTQPYKTHRRELAPGEAKRITFTDLPRSYSVNVKYRLRSEVYVWEEDYEPPRFLGRSPGRIQDYLIASTEIKKIEAPQIAPTEPDTLIRAITNASDSVVSVGGNLNNFVKSYWGGIYVKRGSSYDRVFGPESLGNVMSLESLGNTGQKIEITIHTTKSNNAALRAKLPDVVNLETDFQNAVSYKYTLALDEVGWFGHTSSCEDLIRRLKTTPSGEQVLKEINAYLGEYSELYYLDSAYLFSGKQTTISAKALRGNVDVSTAVHYEGGVAFAYDERNATTKELRRNVYYNRFVKITRRNLSPPRIPIVSGLLEDTLGSSTTVPVEVDGQKVNLSISKLK